MGVDLARKPPVGDEEEYELEYFLADENVPLPEDAAESVSRTAA